MIAVSMGVIGGGVLLFMTFPVLFVVLPFIALVLLCWAFGWVLNTNPHGKRKRP